jgi:DNA invertase Pin-like site-specific DNA recombinase
MQKHIAIYLRVSTKQQDTKSQEPDLKRWAATQELPVVWYRDRFTGKTMDRPGWQKLQHAIDRGEVATVACWRLDRLGRTAKGLTALFSDLAERSINLVSLREGIDLSTPAGRMLANMLASVAQFETECRAERVLAGQEAARAAGKRWGGSTPGRLLKVTQEQIDVIARLKQAGEGPSAMARATGLSRPTIYNVLENHLDKATAV